MEWDACKLNRVALEHSVMGFSTIYLRPFCLDRALDAEHAEALWAFNEEEHEGFFVGDGSAQRPLSIYCQWVPTEDRQGLEWDKVEKFYDGPDWLEYLIAEFLMPWGYTLNGESPWYIDDFHQAGILKVTDNMVVQQPGEINAIKQHYGELDEC